mmetsp:Transcript_22200/g.35691  ORF Transcript_22200/g.35691 Transcript_22200/m.35691 type:complete len:115 (+) Transcript_22200:188-532(+)
MFDPIVPAPPQVSSQRFKTSRTLAAALFMFSAGGLYTAMFGTWRERRKEERRQERKESQEQRKEQLKNAVREVKEASGKVKRKMEGKLEKLLRNRTQPTDDSTQQTENDGSKNS